ncbi:GerMN domain-containing protein [Alteribacter aurantiacus]|uniref:GerMN domain-containing protein n=1 Tax=Alteribacter aurantiacus TaxID=254410 RepID=UPI0003F9FBC2|nr:GerMN domain-containing protein [Alteribacter aurantiacus]
MTKKSRWDEQDIENTLKDLPPIKDRQSKDDLFAKIEKRAAEQPAPQRAAIRQKKPWLYPVMASAAAIFLLVLIVPSFLSNQNEQSLILNSSDQGDSSSDNETAMYVEEDEEVSDDMETEPESHEAPATDDSAGEEADYEENVTRESDSIERDEENEVNSADLQENDDTETEQEEQEQEQETRMVTLPVPYVYSTETDFVVAIKNETVETTEPLEELLAQLLTEEGETEKLTLPGLNEITFINDETVQLDFTEEDEERYASLSSSETNNYREGIMEVFTSLGYEQVVLTTEGEDGFLFGAEGVVESWDLRNGEGPLGYVLYTTETGETVLVHSSQVLSEDESLGTFEETVEWMKEMEGNANLHSPLPEYSEEGELISEVKEENGGLIITFDEAYSFEEGSKEQGMMLKALLYTAGEYGYDYVVFEGEGATEVDGITLGEQVSPEDRKPNEQ